MVNENAEETPGRAEELRQSISDMAGLADELTSAYDELDASFAGLRQARERFWGSRGQEQEGATRPAPAPRNPDQARLDRLAGGTPTAEDRAWWQRTHGRAAG